MLNLIKKILEDFENHLKNTKSSLKKAVIALITGKPKEDLEENLIILLLFVFELTLFLVFLGFIINIIKDDGFFSFNFLCVLGVLFSIFLLRYFLKKK